MKILLILCFSLCCLLSFSQPKESFYVLDTNWKQTVVDSAKYLIWIHESEEGNWIYNYYHMWGPMIKLETYKDHDGTQLNGLVCYYYKTGSLDSMGHYENGKKEGSFYKYLFLPGDSLSEALQYDYVHDSLTKTIDYSKDDSANDDNEAGDKESQYPGGSSQWQQYLGKNLHYPERAADYEKQGEVRTAFTVDEQGNVSDPVISKSVEYSLDREALRIIKLSGKWEPGLKHGKQAKTYKVQPIRFELRSQ
jgi:protein TonB